MADDCYAAVELERLLAEAAHSGRYIGVVEVCEPIRGRTVCIAGGSAELAEALDHIYACNTVIAVDGASTLLLDNNIIPDLIVGDADGSWNTLITLSREYSVPVILHAHGDNTAAVRYLVPLMRRVTGLSQCRGSQRLYSLPPFGFTDGDKAVALALLCSASRVRLLGMNFNGKTGWWSKPWLKHATRPSREKMVKLRIAKKIVETLTAHMTKAGIIVEPPPQPMG